MPVRCPHLLFCLLAALMVMVGGPMSAADGAARMPSAASLADIAQNDGECLDHGHASRARCCSPLHCLTAMIVIAPDVPELYAHMIVGRAAETELASRAPGCPDRPPKP